MGGGGASGAARSRRPTRGWAAEGPLQLQRAQLRRARQGRRAEQEGRSWRRSSGCARVFAAAGYGIEMLERGAVRGAKAPTCGSAGGGGVEEACASAKANGAARKAPGKGVGGGAGAV